MRMKWKPNHVMCGFAILPVELADGDWVWLQRFWYYENAMRQQICFASKGEADRLYAETNGRHPNFLKGPPPERRG